MTRGTVLTPLAELEGFRSEHLACNLNLPDYVPADQIGLDVPRLEKWAQLGGLARVQIGAEQSVQSQYQQEATGHDYDGSPTTGTEAVVSKANIVVVSTKNEENKCSSSEYWWANADITINSTELYDRVLAMGREGGASAGDPNIWGRLIDKAIRQGIASAAKQQLLDNVSKYSKLVFAVTAAATVLSSLGPGGFDVQTLVAQGLFWSGLEQSLNAIANSVSGYPVRERRLSLIPGYQVDRLLVVQGLARTRKLVKPIATK